MTSLKNDRIIRALLRQPTDRTPIWLMRQAGRYLPEYRATRAKAGDFLTLCKTPELACEVTMQPLARFNLDAAILFSDILTIPDAMGLGLYFTEDKGPQFKNPIRSKSDIEKLGVPDPETDLRYVTDATRLIRRELKNTIPLIGFSGSPWTLATYMVEGQSSRTFERIKGLLKEDPKALHHLLKILTEAVTVYLKAQIMAGAQVIMIFDTWGGILTTEEYQDFSLNAMTEIINGLPREFEGQRIPVVLFTKNGSRWIERIADSGCDAISVDWTISMHEARSRVGHRLALQGNLNPEMLYESPERIRQEVKAILNSYGEGTGHIFNLGHGIPKDVSPEHVKVMVDAVRESSPVYKTDSR